MSSTLPWTPRDALQSSISAMDAVIASVLKMEEAAVAHGHAQGYSPPPDMMMVHVFPNSSLMSDTEDPHYNENHAGRDWNLLVKIYMEMLWKGRLLEKSDKRENYAQPCERRNFPSQRLSHKFHAVLQLAFKYQISELRPSKKSIINVCFFFNPSLFLLGWLYQTNVRVSEVQTTAAKQ